MGAIVFALLTAASNAVSTTTRHAASAVDAKGLSGWKLALRLLHSPLWLLGWSAQIGAFVFQAIALHNGEVSVVQPLLVTELVIALVLRRVWLRESVATAAWGGAGLTCAGLAVFVAAAEPQGGGPTPTAGHWVSAIAVCAAVAAVLTVLGRRGSPARRAAVLATAAGITWALEATFIKTTTDTLSQFGVAGMFARWPVYALAVGGAAGVVLDQAALQSGPLRTAQPMLVIVDPLVSIPLSVWLFSEHFVMEAPTLAVAATAFCAMCAGVILVTQTAPGSGESGQVKGLPDPASGHKKVSPLPGGSLQPKSPHFRGKSEEDCGEADNAAGSSAIVLMRACQERSSRSGNRARHTLRWLGQRATS